MTYTTQEKIYLNLSRPLQKDLKDPWNDDQSLC